MNGQRVSVASIAKQAAVSAVGVLIGSQLIDGISYSDPAALTFAVLLLALFSAVLKPVLVLFALPFVVLTLGFGILFINALLYLLVGRLLGGFEVATFSDAFFGALIITVLNLVFNAWIGGGPGARVVVGRRVGQADQAAERPRVKARDDVIDI